jgi:hypothetical protein
LRKGPFRNPYCRLEDKCEMGLNKHALKMWSGLTGSTSMSRLGFCEHCRSMVLRWRITNLQCSQKPTHNNILRQFNTDFLFKRHFPILSSWTAISCIRMCIMEIFALNRCLRMCIMQIFAINWWA